MSDHDAGNPADGGLDDWIRTGDLDELLREVDRACARGDWRGLLTLRDRCRRSGESGHQLWPAASYAEYRAALEAPAAVAGAVVDEGGGYLAAGPLSEVVAVHHTWAELDAHLRDPVARRLVVRERALRGERITGADEDPDDPPASLQDWESDYGLAEYRADGARFPTPDLPAPRSPMTGSVRAQESDGDDGGEALAGSVRHWATRSSGTVRTTSVAGDAADAVRTLVADRGSPEETLLGVELTPGQAATHLGWAAASGAAHGPRRGASAGRFDAWWTMAVLAGVEDQWPRHVGAAAAELRWWRWAPATGDVGWWCRLAVEDPEDGLAWALEAIDRR